MGAIKKTACHCTMLITDNRSGSTIYGRLYTQRFSLYAIELRTQWQKP